MDDSRKRRLLAKLVSHSSTSMRGRLASWLAGLLTDGYKSKAWIGTLHPRGFISHSADIALSDLQRGKHTYIGDDCSLFATETGGAITLNDGVRLYRDIIMETTDGGSIEVGAYTHIQPRCQFVAGQASIHIGSKCEIAPNCAFYPFDHGFEADGLVRDQPLRSRGDVVVGDGAWLGYGVIVLSGVTIGEGAVIGAGSVVTQSVPANCIAVGSPAQIVKERTGLDKTNPSEQ